jgi:hypothetical protein
MPTTTNFGWTTPADTDLVKDGASAIRTLGSGIDTSFVDLKGGTTGQILSKASNTDLDFTWVAQGSSKSWTLLNAGGTSLTAAQTVTVSGISGKEDLLVVVIGASSASASSYIYIRPNGISANYVMAGHQLTFGSTYSSANFANYGSTTGGGILLAQMNNTAAGTVSGSSLISGCSSTGNKAFTSVGNGNTGNNQIAYSLNGFIPASAAITSIDVYSETGNFDAGTVYVYGA